MKYRVLASLLILWGIVLLQGQALAGGVGPFISLGRETPEGEFPTDLLRTYYEGYDPEILVQLEQQAQELKTENTIDHLTFGILYDSAPRQNKIFNNRVSLGFDIATKTKVENVDEINLSTLGTNIPANAYSSIVGDLDEPSTYGGSFQNTFAFAPIRLSLFKWWLGPGFRTNFNYYELNNKEEALGLSMGGGIETGLNLHLGSILSLCVSGGYHWMAYGYAAGDDNIGAIKWGNGPYYFIQAGILFHTGVDKRPWK